ncbi:hypothetical protein AWENTII_003330 [Aspergillus wentii]
MFLPLSRLPMGIFSPGAVRTAIRVPLWQSGAARSVATVAAMHATPLKHRNGSIVHLPHPILDPHGISGSKRPRCSLAGTPAFGTCSLLLVTFSIHLHPWETLWTLHIWLPSL